ncbi:HAT, C-terminal dimerization domain [Fusarium oxysporum f. sp. vasinfectum]|nr:HAT, C-terminal dimerization domain [Fusarium oxysporum f. sp. vasinfectum]
MAPQSDLFSYATDTTISEISCPEDPTLPMHNSSSRSSHSIIKDWDAVSQAVRSHWVLSARTGQATGWFWAHGYDVQARSKGNESGPHTWLCCHCVQHGVPRPKAYVSSNTRNIEGHLSKAHNIFHPDPSKATRYMQERPPNQPTLHDLAAKKRKRDDFHDELVTRFDKATFQRHVVQWITDANLSFRVPEHKGLQKVFQYLNPLVHETCANLTHETVRARIIDEFNTYKSRPRKIVLGLPNVAIAHTGENISAAVMEVLDDFELIANNKVGYIILDNAASNEGAVEAIGHKFQWQNPDLDADDFAEWTKRGPVGKLHNLVVWVNRSNKATAILRKLQDEDPDKSYPGTLDVVLDNSTRWLSQYYMIERAIKLRRYLEELIDITIQSSRKFQRPRSTRTQPPSQLPRCLEEANLLSDADWDALSWFRDILRMFDSCLLRLEGDCQLRVRKGGVEAQYGIIWQVAVAFEFLLSTLEKAKTEATHRVEPSYYSSCVNSAWAKLNKYYTKLDETPIYYAATVLHPGIQWSFLTKAYGEKEEWLFAARQLIQKLWEEEYRDLPAQWEISSSNLPAAMRAREYNPFDSFQDELISSTRHGHDEATDELERWLSTKQDIYTTYDNPLEYWSAKRFEYPRVAKMAIDILSVPAMASECERTFSSAGSMVSPKRSHLDASTIAVTQTVRSWLRAGLLEGYEGLLKEVGDDTAED